MLTGIIKSTSGGFLSSRRRQQKRYIFASILIFAFFARYSVALGHDCRRVNLIESIQYSGHTEDQSAAASGNHHCHHSSEDAENKPVSSKKSSEHDHETCPICVNYVTLDKIAAYFHDILITIQLQNVAFVTIPQCIVMIGSSIKYNALPRAPPVL